MPPGADERARLLGDLVDSVTDYAIVALDVDGHVATWNAGAECIKGYSEAEILGRHFSAFYTPSDVEAGRPDMALAIAVADGRYEDSGWRVRSDGSQFWANVIITPIRGGDGRLVGFGKVTRDLTDRRRGEEALRTSEERFRLLVSGVGDYAIYLLTPEGIVDSWNLGAERLKGYTPSEAIGQHFSVFYTAEDQRAGLPQHGLEVARTQGRWEQQGWRLRKDGTKFWADVVLTALHTEDGELRGFAKVTRDLTDRKRNEDALRGVLERERDAAARLRQLDQMKTDLVAIIAHDLRGPVELVHHLLSVARAEEADNAPKQRELLDRALHRTATLSSLVDDILDLARIESGHLEVDAHPIDLAAVAARVISDATESDPDRSVELQIGGEAIALGDENRAWQVLTNLVSNARKFSPEDRPVTVLVDRQEREVVVSVQDHGCGIPVDQQPLLFGRFTRLTSTGGTPGSGIGLFIAKSLVEAQQGRIWFDSTVGVGSTFHFSLPAWSHG